MKWTSRKMLFGLLIMAMSVTTTTYTPTVSAGEFLQQWFQNRLFSPTEQQRVQEERGAVVIYDGMHDIEVNRAMETQFDRIEHMMFIGTIITNEKGEPKRDIETGEIMKEDEDC